MWAAMSPIRLTVYVQPLCLPATPVICQVNAMNANDQAGREDLPLPQVDVKDIFLFSLCTEFE